MARRYGLPQQRRLFVPGGGPGRRESMPGRRNGVAVQEPSGDQLQAGGGGVGRRGRRPSGVKFSAPVMFQESVQSGDFRGIVEAGALLRRKSVDVQVNAINQAGLTALHQAALDGNIDFVKLLVRHGAKVNCQDEDGWTPLHAAVAEGHPQVARFLIRSGARRSVRNADGDTPEELVEEEDAEMESVFREEVEGVEGAIGEADEEGALGGEEENGGAVEWSDSAGISVRFYNPQNDDDDDGDDDDDDEEDDDNYRHMNGKDEDEEEEDDEEDEDIAAKRFLAKLRRDSVYLVKQKRQSEADAES
ncbi:PREDICTED: protein phosphatase 1 regulatory subunit 12B-like isoform X3 [Branchiostoma belcheri]|uniref:Protein phosphatase 1 regulatory subunit 12B-like isoform X2 n=1 Tax=Branchiostoma belcheri TaxID=7741 RepID=A0A6P4YT47_BRABE|nr:PREDICTED: protein phosphatase 1 regulatory subunit 12B-like isoform X2 [Branchiostoma belcheri]XP_019627544.1 PREDICTED: protein phosphatase 1 regulatory subunit 12B-like isoform X3 [Branchiostoma belcheri]